MTNAEIERVNAKRQKFTVLDKWFDYGADEALQKHLTRRYNRYERRRNA